MFRSARRRPPILDSESVYPDHWVSAAFSRAAARWLGPRLLVLLATLSYLTSFVRERFLLQEALGSSALDGAVATFGIASMVGNLYGIGLSLAWVDGRTIPKWASSFAAYALVGGALGTVWPVGGSGILLASLVAGFEYARQRSVFRNRQPAALLASLLAPAASIVVWKAIGTASVVAIVAGYAAGYIVQTGASWWLARSAQPHRSFDEHRLPVSVLWPFLFAAFGQLNGLLDRVALPLISVGWAGAAGFALSMANATILALVGPLASEAVAGKIRKQVSLPLVFGIGFAALAAILALPFLLPLVVGGGAVTGDNLGRLQFLSVVYFAAMPASGYWAFRGRALQGDSALWRPIGLVTATMFGTHVLFVVAAVALREPALAPIGYFVSMQLGALLLARTKWLATVDSIADAARRKMSRRH